MIVLILILCITTIIIALLTYLNRRNKKEDTPVVINENEECCGAHAVCDRDSLLNSDANIEYFDDEDLDELADITPEKLTSEQVNMISEVFYTLKESDVAAWLRSLQLRRIQLPDDLREQALMIIRERR